MYKEKIFSKNGSHQVNLTRRHWNWWINRVVGFLIEFAPVIPALAGNGSPFKAEICTMLPKGLYYEYCYIVSCFWAGSHWPKKILTYKIKKYTTDMPKSDVDREIARAFQMWADVTDLTFVHVKNPSADVDIDIL